MIYLLFKIDGESYALPSANIVEVIPLLPLRQLPKVPEYVAGMFNYRTQLIPVLDLTRLFTPRASSQCASTRIAVVNYRQQGGKQLLLGVIVEQATETLPLDEVDFTPQSIANPSTPYFNGSGLATVNQKKRQIQRVDIREFLPESVQQILYPESTSYACE